MTHSNYQLNAEQMSKLLHDIRAPITTTIAFKAEIMESINDLTALIDSLDSELTAESRMKLHDIINQDLKVCATHMETSIDTLQLRVTQFASEFALLANSKTD